MSLGNSVLLLYQLHSEKMGYLYIPCMHILCQNLKFYTQNSGNKSFAKDSDGEFFHCLTCIVFEALIGIQ